MFCPVRVHFCPDRWSGLATTPHRLSALCAGAALALLGAGAQAQVQAQPGASRIDRVTLYQGSATVERTLALAAGAREAVFTCLPAALDPQSLQAQGGDGVRVGEVRVDTSERALVPECAGAQDAGIRSVEDELARVNAALSALQLSDRYLKTVATLAPSEGGTTLAAPGPAAIQATAEALRSSLEASQVRAHRLQRDQSALEQRLRALQQEQGRSAGAPQGRVARVRVQLATERAGTLRLAYQVRGPAWHSSYRATLDVGNGDNGNGNDNGNAGQPGGGGGGGASVRLERQATVSQGTGEDWSGVQLRLSTGAPQRAAQGQLPRPWVLDLAPPPPPAPAQLARGKAVAETADLAMAAPAPAPAQEPPLPDFAVQVQEGAYATEFAVPGRTSVPGNGERTTLSLGSTALPARLLTRTAPAVEPAAYLVAHIARPAGVWPAGPVALLQGARFIGNGRLDFSSSRHNPAGSAATEATSAELAFGRDDRVEVRAEPVQELRGTAGLTGASTERTVQSSYRIDNQHAGAIELQVLHAAPVSRDERIEVRSRYTPAPASLGFGGTPGTVLWQHSLAAGASARFAAEHVLRYPADAPLRERH